MNKIKRKKKIIKDTLRYWQGLFSGGWRGFLVGILLLTSNFGFSPLTSMDTLCRSNQAAATACWALSTCWGWRWCDLTSGFLSALSRLACAYTSCGDPLFSSHHPRPLSQQAAFGGWVSHIHSDAVRLQRNWQPQLPLSTLWIYLSLVYVLISSG